MPNPYLYPRTRHTRTRSPQQYKNYRQYKQDLREEFGGQCVYCRALDKIKGQEAFGVDHYRPKSLFPHRAVEYSNLFYSCNRCNSLKREYWPNFLEQQIPIFIPNPCDHIMFEHVRYRGGTVAHASVAGEFTIERLDLNDPDAVEFRSALIRALMLAEARIESAVSTLQEAETRLKRAKSSSDKLAAEADVDAAKENVAMLVGIVKGLIGP